MFWPATRSPRPLPRREPRPLRAAARGDFTNEVIELVKAAYARRGPYPREVQARDQETRGQREHYKEVKLDLNTKEVLIYLYGDKNGPYNVALIFEYPKTEVNNLSPKIGLSLEAFAVGEAASRAFSGGGEEREAKKRPTVVRRCRSRR